MAPQKLEWEETHDDSDNSVWEAASPYGEEEGSSPFMWRLKQRLFANAVEWHPDHDADIADQMECRTWTSLEQAKAEIQKDDDELRAQMPFEE